MYLRLSPYREILQGILIDLEVNEGIIKITGKSGTGKTALCSQLFQELESAGQPAVFFLVPPANATELQNNILDNLKLDRSGNFTRTLTAYLLEKTTNRKPLVLIFDDAQHLDQQSFSAVRMLCNIQHESHAMIRVILSGNEELDQKLATSALRSVTQFLSQSIALTSLTQEQVRDYCQGYWQMLGVDMKPLGDKALQKLFQETQGHPGILQARLNQGTTGAEKAGSKNDMTSDMAARPGKYPGQRPGWVPAMLTIAGLVVLGGLGAYLYLGSGSGDNSTTATDDAPVAVESTEESTEQSVVEITDTVTVENADPVIAEEAVVEESPATVAAESNDAVAETAEVVVAPTDSEATPADAQAPAEQPLAEPSVADFIAEWTQSWQSQNVDAYFAHYHPEFAPPQGLTREAWEEQRRRVIGNASAIMISVDAPESDVEAQDGMRLVRFWLHYSTATYADRTLKELLLAQVDGNWRIRAENNLRTER